MRWRPLPSATGTALATPMHPQPPEHHLVQRAGWLRAAVLGANDGILSTASLIVGVAAGAATLPAILLSGTAGLFGGALAMAAGEYVSVSSQADSERADLERERLELVAHPAAELRELAGIYIKRGLDPLLAKQVAEQLSAHDALGAHARDELGLSDTTAARPLQAAFASALAFAVGAALPLLTAILAPRPVLIAAVFVATLVFLALLGVVGARAGGAPVGRGAGRVLFWGALAMLVTAAIGRSVGAMV